MAHPPHRRGQTRFVASLRHPVEDCVRAQQGFQAAAKCRVGVEDGGAGILVEKAQARIFLTVRGRGAKVVRLGAAGDFRLSEGNREITVEVAAGRTSTRARASPSASRIRRASRTLLGRSAPASHPAPQMLERSVDVIRHVRAARATLGPIGPKHEMIRGELASPVEQVRKARLAMRPVEHIFLSTRVQGSSRRCRLSSSLNRVSSFSLARKSP